MSVPDNELRILQGDALTELRRLPAESVHCCVTSPPYWGLRDYGTASWMGGDADCDHNPPASSKGDYPGSTRKQQTNSGSFGYREWMDCGKCGAKRIDAQLGLEKTPAEYVAKMLEIFREVRRVLRKDGTLWLNLGDSYNGLKVGSTQENVGARRHNTDTFRKELWDGLKPKDLCGIPWRVAFALQADGWWLRQDIIWAKPNPMPESVSDRCTKAHEYIFLLTKSSSYFYDAEAIKEQGAESSVERARYGWNGKMEFQPNGSELRSQPDPVDKMGERWCPSIRNKRSVWTITTQPYPEAHFATFPEELPKICILAGTSAKGCCAKCGAPWERIVEKGELRLHPECWSAKTAVQFNAESNSYQETNGSTLKHSRDIKTLGWQPTRHGEPSACECGKFSTVPCTVLDMFAGSGTTGAVALELGRRVVLIELNPKYVELINQRCNNVTLGLALA